MKLTLNFGLILKNSLIIFIVQISIRCCRYAYKIEGSDEYEENVIDIAESDGVVQTLLNDGFNITRVRPIIKAEVDGDGNVVTKATDAVVVLEKDATSHAFVWVDLEEGKVTRIEILTRTVIEKS